MKKRYVILPVIALLSCVVPFSGHNVYAGEGCTYIPEITNGVCGVDPSGSGNVKVEGGAAQGTVVTDKSDTYNASINGTTPGTGPSTTTEQTIIPGGTTTTTTEKTNSSSNTTTGSTTNSGNINGNQQTGGNPGTDGTNGNGGASKNDGTPENPGSQGSGGSNGGDGATGNGGASGNNGTNNNGNNKGNGGTTGKDGSSGKPGTSGGNTDTKKPVLTKQDLIDAGIKVDTTYEKIQIKVDGKVIETIIMTPGKDGTVYESGQQQKYPSQTTTDTEEDMSGWSIEEKKLDYADWDWKNITNKEWIRENGDNYKSMGKTTPGTTLKWTLGHREHDDGTWSIKMTPHYTVKYMKKVKKTITEREEYSWEDENGKEHTGHETVTREVEEPEYKTKKETGTPVEYQVTVPLICSSCPEITICIKGELDEGDGDVEVKDDDKKTVCDCGDPYTKCDDSGEPTYTVKYHSELSQ